MSDNQLKNIQDRIALKLPEPKIQSGKPWSDDALGRQEVATALTNLVSGQSNPFTISLHGDWGTGKTFLLKRWQAELKQDKCEAIYFNAWEDDFQDDPLVAIIGQLTSVLRGYAEIINSIKKAAGILIKETVLATVRLNGIPVSDISSEEFGDSILKQYTEQRESKDKLKGHLTKLSSAVIKKSGKPLVFIIDELDRCRPTFAVELLERVKHIFDIPGMVFVFGVNQGELRASIKSIYGEIDAETYLQRFFDMSLLLPEADREKFFGHLVARYELQNSFADLSDAVGKDIHRTDFDMFGRFLFSFYGRLNLSLRDMHHCIRALAFVGKTIPAGVHMHPYIISVLIFLRIKNGDLYHKFLKGECLGADVMDYINETAIGESLDRTAKNIFYTIEVELYLTDAARGCDSVGQLQKFIQTSEKPDPSHLSKKTLRLDVNRDSDKETIQGLLRILQNGAPRHWQRPSLKYVSSLIELTEISARRESLWD